MYTYKTNWCVTKHEGKCRLPRTSRSSSCALGVRASELADFGRVPLVLHHITRLTTSSSNHRRESLHSRSHCFSWPRRSAVCRRGDLGRTRGALLGKQQGACSGSRTARVAAHQIQRRKLIVSLITAKTSENGNSRELRVRPSIASAAQPSGLRCQSDLLSVRLTRC